MSALPKLSDGLRSMADSFASVAEAGDDEDITLDNAEARKFLAALQTMHKIAVDMEIELVCLRDAEAGRQVRRAIESEAEAVQSQLTTGGNVVHGLFDNRGGKA